MDDINSNFGIILGKDFLNELNVHSRESVFDEKKDELSFYRKNSNKILTDVKRVFELRHIFCHEIAYEFDLTFEDISASLDSAIKFLNQMEDYINNLLRKTGDRAVPTEIEDAEKELNTITETLEKRIYAIKKMKNVNWPQQFQESFEEFITAWKICIQKKSNWDESMPYTGNYQILARLRSLIKSKSEMIEYLNSFVIWE